MVSVMVVPREPNECAKLSVAALCSGGHQRVAVWEGDPKIASAELVLHQLAELRRQRDACFKGGSMLELADREFFNEERLELGRGVNFSEDDARLGDREEFLKAGRERGEIVLVDVVGAPLMFERESDLGQLNGAWRVGQYGAAADRIVCAPVAWKQDWYQGV